MDKVTRVRESWGSSDRYGSTGRMNVRMPGRNDSEEEVSHYLEHLAKFLD